MGARGKSKLIDHIVRSRMKMLSILSLATTLPLFLAEAEVSSSIRTDKLITELI